MRSKGFLQVVGLHALQFERSLRKSLDNGNPCHAALAGQIAIYRLCKPQDYLGQTLCYAFCMERSQVHAGFAHRRVEIAVADLPNVTSAPAKSRFAGSEQYCFGAALSIRTGCRLTRLEYKTLNGTQWAYPLRE